MEQCVGERGVKETAARQSCSERDQEQDAEPVAGQHLSISRSTIDHSLSLASRAEKESDATDASTEHISNAIIAIVCVIIVIFVIVIIVTGLQIAVVCRRSAFADRRSSIAPDLRFLPTHAEWVVIKAIGAGTRSWSACQVAGD